MKLKLPKEILRYKSKDNMSKKYYLFYNLFFYFLLGSNLSRLKTQDNSPNQKFLSNKKSNLSKIIDENLFSPKVPTKRGSNNDLDFQIELKSIKKNT